MPIEPLAKNKGPLLTTKIRGSVDNFPKEFLALIGLDITNQMVPLDVDPDDILGLLVESKIVQERTNERRKTNTSLTEFPDTDLPSETFIDESGMTGTRHRQLVPEGTILPVDTNTVSGDQHNLGNGWLDQVVVEAPDLYPKTVYSAERRIVTPDDFLGLLPIRTWAHTEEGFAVQPTLTDGDISTQDEEDTIWHHRLTEKSIEVLGLPMEILNFRTNEFKQLEFVDRWLQDADDPAHFPSPTSTRNVEFTKLGDGTALNVAMDTITLFDQEQWQKQRPVVTPEDFRALLAETTHSLRDDNPVTEPTLTAGQISVEEQRLDEFNRRISTRGIDILSLPQHRFNLRTNEFKQVEYVDRYLEDDDTVPANPTSTRNVEFTLLGDGTALEVRTHTDDLFPREQWLKDRPVVTPEDFRALLRETTHVLTEPGIISEPVLTGGVISKTEDQVDVFNRRTTTKEIDILSLPRTNINHKTNEFKQDVTIARVLEDDSTTPLPATATRDVEWTKLGDGTALEVRSTVDDVFPREQWAKERPVVTPEDFRASLKETTHVLTDTGLVSEPVLTTGVISKSEDQVDMFNLRTSTREIDSSSLPETNVNYKTNEFKQIVTVTRVLEDDSTTPSLPTAVRDVDWTKLGDGTALEVRSVVDDLFDRLTTSVEFIDLVPDIFKAVLPVYSRDHIETGIVDDPPVPDPGDLEKREQQVDVFNKRVSSRGRGNVTVPQDKVAARKIGGEPYGAEVTQVHAFLDDSEPLIETGFDVVSSQVRDLGTGLWTRETEKLDTATTWPELEGQEYDESLDVLVPFIEQTISAGTELGAPHTDIKPQDKWRSKKRTIDSTAAEVVLGAYLMEYPSKININMPDKLVSLSAQMTSQTGDASDSETGNSTGYGNYSINLDLRADATASATAIPEVFADIKQFYGPNIDCIHYVFFLPNPVTQADVLAKINALLAPATVSAWPKFNPKTETFLIVGTNAALKVNAVSKGSYSQSADMSSSSSTAGGGTGYSRSRGLTLRRMQISPTIHGSLTMSGTSSTSINLHAACSSEAVGLGPAESIDQTDTVTANVTPTSLAATAGATDWPVTGKFLYRVDARPYKYGFVMFHAIVVDAANFPSSP